MFAYVKMLQMDGSLMKKLRSYKCGMFQSALTSMYPEIEVECITSMVCAMRRDTGL